MQTDLNALYCYSVITCCLQLCYHVDVYTKTGGSEVDSLTSDAMLAVDQQFVNIAAVEQSHMIETLLHSPSIFITKSIFVTKLFISLQTPLSLTQARPKNEIHNKSNRSFCSRKHDINKFYIFVSVTINSDPTVNWSISLSCGSCGRTRKLMFVA